MPKRHRERHRLQRVGWLRAAVLGANDGIVSTASLLVGVAAADASHAQSCSTAGVAARRRAGGGDYVPVRASTNCGARSRRRMMIWPGGTSAQPASAVSRSELTVTACVALRFAFGPTSG